MDKEFLMWIVGMFPQMKKEIDDYISGRLQFNLENLLKSMVRVGLTRNDMLKIMLSTKAAKGVVKGLTPQFIKDMISKALATKPVQKSSEVLKRAGSTMARGIGKAIRSVDKGAEWLGKAAGSGIKAATKRLVSTPTGIRIAGATGGPLVVAAATTVQTGITNAVRRAANRPTRTWGRNLFDLSPFGQGFSIIENTREGLTGREWKTFGEED